MTMNKYLYLPALAVLALAACDDNKADTAAQQDPSILGYEQPNVTNGDSFVPPSADAYDAQNENYVNEDLSSSVDAATAPAGNVPPGADGQGNAGPSDGMTANDTPPAPNPETFSSETAEEPDVVCDFESWVGQSVNEETVKAEGRPYRIVKPGDAMTMDYNAQRINVEHGDDNIVTRVWCG